jgi:hypothetical protein
MIIFAKKNVSKTITNNVTKREGPKKTDDAYTTCPRPPAPTFYRSVLYLLSIEPLMLDLPAFSSLTHYASTDYRTQ